MGVYLRGKSWYYDFYYEGKRYTEKVGKVAKSVAEMEGGKGSGLAILLIMLMVNENLIR